ncbi:hypothetical protein ACVWW6_000083 [Bradyrhizobium sp. USDA 3311]
MIDSAIGEEVAYVARCGAAALAYWRLNRHKMIGIKTIAKRSRSIVLHPPESITEVRHFLEEVWRTYKQLRWTIDARLSAFRSMASRSGKSRQLWIARHQRSPGSRTAIGVQVGYKPAYAQQQMHRRWTGRRFTRPSIVSSAQLALRNPIVPHSRPLELQAAFHREPPIRAGNCPDIEKMGSESLCKSSILIAHTISTS